MRRAIVCTFDKTYSIGDGPDGAKRETAGWFGFCQRFDSTEEEAAFIDYIKSLGYREEVV